MIIQKSILFPHTKNERSQTKIMKTIMFIIASIRIKYLGINLTKAMHDLHTEHYKALLKEIKDVN